MAPGFLVENCDLMKSLTPSRKEEARSLCLFVYVEETKQKLGMNKPEILLLAKSCVGSFSLFSQSTGNLIWLGRTQLGPEIDSRGSVCPHPRPGLQLPGFLGWMCDTYHFGTRRGRWTGGWQCQWSPAGVLCRAGERVRSWASSSSCQNPIRLQDHKT